MLLPRREGFAHLRILRLADRPRRRPQIKANHADKGEAEKVQGPRANKTAKVRRRAGSINKGVNQCHRSDHGGPLSGPAADCKRIVASGPDVPSTDRGPS